MNNNKLILSDAAELAFERLLESDGYDSAEETLFGFARAAFKAGWEAGLAKSRKRYKIKFLLRRSNFPVQKRDLR